MGKRRETKIVDGVLYQKCTKCEEWLPATNKYFNWGNKEKQQLKNRCKECQKEDGAEYRSKNKDKIHKYQRKYNAEHKDEIKEWHKNNPEKLKEYSKRTCEKHRESRRKRSREWAREYRKNNPEIARERNNKYSKIYYKNNRKKLKERRKVYNRKYYERKASFSTYAPQLTIEELSKDDGNGHLLVRCAYCGRYFYPKTRNVMTRIQSLKGAISGENRLYCSNGCKEACPIFNQRKFPKGYKKASSREVDPLIRQMCLERDGYTCQKCEKDIDEVELHCHHIEGVTKQPILANDVENTITLCKPCHKWVHTQGGCTYYDLRCEK